MNLMQDRRFAPFFWTQALGAFNDNVFKQVVLLLLTYEAVPRMHWDGSLVNSIGMMLFMLPTLVFSSWGGRLADTQDKAPLIRALKTFEVACMAMAALAIWCEAYIAMLGILALVGVQAALFGPVKYAILPQHVPRAHLVGANAWVEMGTFLAILLGTILAGVLAELPDDWRYRLIGVVLIAVALAGWWSARRIPSAPPLTAQPADSQVITRSSLKLFWTQRSMRFAILGISLFWFLGTCYLSQLNVWVKDVAATDMSMVSALMASFAIGVGLGAALYSKLSVGRLELGLVPIGALIIALCGTLFAYSGPKIGMSGEALTLMARLRDGTLLPMMLELIGVGIGGGLYIMPLYLMLQIKSDPNHRARMIAINNIVNALFMLVASLFAILIVNVLHWSLPVFYALVALCALLIGVASFGYNPRPCLRILTFMGMRLCYKLRIKGREFIPEEGAAVVVCNHVSYTDALILAAASPRPLRFVMYAPIYEMPLINGFCRIAGAIPINNARNTPSAMRRTFRQIKKALDAGEVVMIFPEGQLTRNGEIGSFQRGIERIIEETPVPVIPAALSGLWGGWGTHKGSAPFSGWPKKIHTRVRMMFGEPVPPEQVTRELLYQRVCQLKQYLDSLQ